MKGVVFPGDRKVMYLEVPDPGHAPYLKVPANTLVTLPDELSFETGGRDFVRHRNRLRCTWPSQSFGA
jgi:hypothetical protein